MTLSTQPYKGARDFYPEDKQRQDYMFGIIRDTVKRYGYAEYDAPVIEPLDLYRAKTGEEIINEQVYSFTDRGGREVAIRPEITPTVSRMVAAKRQELAYPLRWFSIPNLWRYERPQRGRLREHWQLNVDIFGDAGLAADHEAIAVSNDVLQAFGATPEMYIVKVNCRKLMNSLMSEYLVLDSQQAHDLSKLIDRMNKMPREKFVASVTEIAADKVDAIMELLASKEISDLPEAARQSEYTVRLTTLLDMLRETGITNAIFDITLMRGFDYYTDIVFEINDTDPDNNRSMFGGGRYDGLVGLFGVEPVPTVGFGMGDVTLANFLESHNLLPSYQNATDVVIVTIGDVYAPAYQLAQTLRKDGVNVSIDSTDRKLDKKIKVIAKQSISFALFVGEDDIEKNAYQLKNLKTGESSTVPVEQISAILRDNQ